MAELEMILETDRAEIHRVVLGPLSTNVYVIRCSTSSRSIMVDAADNGPFLAGLCERFNAAQVLLSHGHWDHIQGVPALRSSGVAVAIGAGDAAMLGGNYDELLSHNSTVMAGDVALQVIHTPGHTPGSCCFWYPEGSVLFSGDTLFPGGPGNTATPEGDFDAIITSLGERVFTLAEDALVLPGHGPSTTLAAEAPQLGAWRARGW